MKRELLDRLLCPRCKSRFQTTVPGGEIDFGLLECDCTSYPIVSGIPVLRTDALTSIAIDLLQDGEHRNAVNLLLNRSTTLPLRRMIGELGKKVKSLPGPFLMYLSVCSTLDRYRHDISEYAYFSNMIESFESEYFSQYLRYRPFEQSFWNLHAFLPFILDHEGPILDFGGGWGHSSYLLHRITGRAIYNLEIDFRPLYLQQQYMSTQIGGIVVEPGMDLPFAPQTFRTVLDLDGFHYVENKYGIAPEYERVTRDGGAVLLLHTHHSGVTDRGVPLSPSAYRDCFSWVATVVGEEDLLSGFLDGSVRVTDLPNPHDTSQDLNIVISKRPIDDLTLEMRDHPFETDVGNIIVNPLYEITERDDHWKLRRAPLEEKFATEFSFSVDNTQPEYRLPKDDSVPPSLLYRGILAPLPSTYAPGPSLET